MKLFNNKVSKSRIFQALFGWSMLLPSRSEPTKPFEGKITSTEADDEQWIEPLVIAEDSILRATDPVLMTRKERHESMVRYWMECKGYSKEEILEPLTDQRMKELGRNTYGEFTEAQIDRKKKFIEKFGVDNPMSQAILLDKPSHLDLGLIERDGR